MLRLPPFRYLAPHSIEQAAAHASPGGRASNAGGRWHGPVSQYETPPVHAAGLNRTCMALRH